MPKPKKKRIWVSLPTETIEWLNCEIESKRFKDNSHAVDFVLTEFIKREKRVKTSSSQKSKKLLDAKINKE